MRAFFDLILIPILLVVLAVMLVLTYFITGAIMTKAESVGPIVAFPDVQSKFLIFDKLFVVITAFLACFTLISAYYIDSNPIFFVIGIIGLMIALLIAPSFTNTFDEFITSNQNMTDSANDFPLAVGIIRQLPMIVLVIGTLSSILLYAKMGGYI